MKWGFKVKDSEQRAIPLADDLYDQLLAYQRHHEEQYRPLPHHSTIYARSVNCRLSATISLMASATVDLSSSGKKDR